MNSEPARILVVEDEEAIRNLIALHLKREGHTVDSVGSVEEANSLIGAKEPYNLFALDWMLPGSSGLDLTKRLRSESAQQKGIVPAILMITARAESNDIVDGLEAGADDYLTKPFEPSVLIARVRALLRRNRTPQNDPSVAGPEIQLGALTLNSNTYEVRCGKEPISLTVSEFKLLMALAQSRGRVLTRDSLISQVQGDGVSVVGRTVDTHVFGLRKKLGECADVIETVRGIGYRVKSDL